MAKRTRKDEAVLDFFQFLPDEVFVQFLNKLLVVEFIPLTLTSRKMQDRAINLIQVLDHNNPNRSRTCFTPMPYLYKCIKNFGPFQSLTTLTNCYAMKESEFYEYRMDRIAQNIKVMSFDYAHGAGKLSTLILEKFTNLVALHLSCISEELETMDAFSNLKKLRVLCLEDCQMENYVGLGFLKELEIFSISEGQIGIKSSTSRESQAQLDQALCYLSKLRILRLYCVYTNYTYLEFLDGLEILDLLQTRPRPGYHQEDIVYKLEARFSTGLSNLRFLAMPKFFRIRPQYQLKQQNLTTLFVNRPVDTRGLPSLRYYRFLLKEKYLSDHPCLLPSKDILYTVNVWEFTPGVEEIASRYLALFQRHSVKTTDQYDAAEFWTYVNKHMPDIHKSVFHECCCFDYHIYLPSNINQ